ncbi:hypothetical protein ACOMHN_065629 [Nucella lapillus]
MVRKEIRCSTGSAGKLSSSDIQSRRSLQKHTSRAHDKARGDLQGATTSTLPAMAMDEFIGPRVCPD